MGIQTDSKATIKQRLDSELVTLRPDLQPSEIGTIEYAIAGTAAEVELANQHFANRAIDAISITTATGAGLDNWARIFALTRRVDESDLQLRNRIYRRASNSDANSESQAGYIDRSLTIAGLERAWVGTPGGARVVVWIVSTPTRSTTPGTSPAWAQSSAEKRQEVTALHQNSGSYAATVRVITPIPVPVVITVTIDADTPEIRDSINDRIQALALSTINVITYQDNQAPDLTLLLAAAQTTPGVRNVKAEVTSNGYAVGQPPLGTYAQVTTTFVVRA